MGNARVSAVPFSQLSDNWTDEWLNFCFAVGAGRVEVKDISLTDYIQIRHAVYLPHTAGRYAKKQFKKAQMPIVERLVDRCASLDLPPSVAGLTVLVGRFCAA